MKRNSIFAALVAATITMGCGGGGGSPGTTADGTGTGGNDNGGTSSPPPVTTAPPSSAVSVSIGEGDKIETTAQEIKYARRVAVTVSDTSGLPVKGAKVSFKVEMVGFLKGRLFRDADGKVLPGADGEGIAALNDPDTRVGPAQFCASEDLNKNDIRDANEDTNGDGVLTPEKSLVVATIESSDLTDAQGIVYARVEYPKAHANWLFYRLIATATVTGTEGSGALNSITLFAAGDENQVSTPFVFSPFGFTAGCSNAF
jgi:hypothetical protein